MPEPQFLTFKEVAAITRLSERHLHRLVARNELRPAREGRKLLFPKAEVDAWVAAKLAERPTVGAFAS